MNGAVVVASAAVTAVAAAGVLRPFGRARTEALDRLADPLEEERIALLRSLRDLDEERDTGQLSDADFHTLRRDTERRAVAVLRAIEARDGPDELAAGLGDLRAAEARTSGTGQPNDRRRSRTVVGLILSAVLIAVAVPALALSVRPRDAGAPVTGDEQTSGLAFFEQRVRDHPNDLAARLDLAERYLNSGNPTEAARQYAAALRIDPENAEAWTTLGSILYVLGQPEKGLEDVERALATDPTYPEALYVKGVILLDGLHRPKDAADVFRAYLQAAPFGSHRADTEKLLARAQSGS